MAEPDAIAAALQALQARGIDRRDPAGWQFVVALHRRAAPQHGPLRQQLDLRLARALAMLQQRHGSPAAATPQTGTTAPPPQAGPQASPLSGLLQQLGSGVGLPPAELQAVRRFSPTWARLRVDQQLARALARQPDNAGPLNSQRLMLQTLQRLRQLSPAYLQRFMAHAEALLWLEGRAAGAAASGGVSPPPGPPRPGPPSPAARPRHSRAAPSRGPRSRAAPR